MIGDCFEAQVGEVDGSWRGHVGDGLFDVIWLEDDVVCHDGRSGAEPGADQAHRDGRMEVWKVLSYERASRRLSLDLANKCKFKTNSFIVSC